jgi:hypothetical protein
MKNKKKPWLAPTIALVPLTRTQQIPLPAIHITHAPTFTVYWSNWTPKLNRLSLSLCICLSQRIRIEI